MSGGSTTAIRFPPAHLSDCVLLFDCTAFHCHRLTLWQRCTALRSLLASLPNAACHPQPPLVDRTVAATTKWRRIRRARKPSYSNFTPSWIIADVDEGDEQNEEREEQAGEDKWCITNLSKRQQGDTQRVGLADKPPLPQCSSADKTSSIDLRVLSADERWDAGHWHIFLLHLYFPTQLHCPPFLPSTLLPDSITQLAAEGEIATHILQHPRQPLQLPSALFTCSDGEYVMYECVLAMARSLGCVELMALCEQTMQTVCRVSGRESAWHGLQLAETYQLSGLRAVCLLTLNEGKQLPDAESCSCSFLSLWLLLPLELLLLLL